MFNPFKNKKAISGLIAIILLVVVCVALIVIILSWGKGFTNDSLDGDIVDTYKRSTELSGIIKSKQVIGNNVFLENISTNKNLEIFLLNETIATIVNEKQALFTSKSIIFTSKAHNSNIRGNKTELCRLLSNVINCSVNVPFTLL